MPAANRTASLRQRHFRTLEAVGNGSRTLAKIGVFAGLAGAASGAVLRDLAEAGLAACVVNDIDGRDEEAWQLTDAGRATLDGARAMPSVAGKRGRGGKLEVGCLAPFFGSNRMLAPEVGRLLRGCTWVGVPFVGSFAEVPLIEARTIVCNDLHCHLMNLAKVAADPLLGPALRFRLRKTPFADLELRQAQSHCRELELAMVDGGWDGEPNLDWAVDYFIAAWTSRNGLAGTKGEFKAPLSVRWDAQGGDSVRRFRNAAAGLVAWADVLQRCTLLCMDALEFLERCKDLPLTGIYCDPPFLGAGDAYKHRFGEHEHARLAQKLVGFRFATVVARLYETDDVGRLYPEGKWAYNRFKGRKQTNRDAPEVLLSRNAKEQT